MMNKFKGIAHPKNVFAEKRPQVIPDVDEVWRNVSLPQCLSNGCSAVNGCRQNESQWMLCSEWVPSEWESDKKHHKWSTPVNIWRRQKLRVMQRHISPNLMKKQTHLHLGMTWGWINVWQILFLFCNLCFLFWIQSLMLVWSELTATMFLLENPESCREYM